MNEISLANLIKEKEECDKGCGRIPEEYPHLKCGNKFYSPFANEEIIWLCPRCKATSLALSKGIEVAIKQKKMFEEFVSKLKEEIDHMIEHTNLCVYQEFRESKDVTNFCLKLKKAMHKDSNIIIDKLAEQLEVKDE